VRTVSRRTTIDPEIASLMKALNLRIEGLGAVERVGGSRKEEFRREGVTFLELEVRRDHMTLTLWLPEDRAEEARASGIARNHPFSDDAVRVRFERAKDITHVGRWVEASYAYAENRSQN
jgi:hypothetical protein